MIVITRRIVSQPDKSSTPSSFCATIYPLPPRGARTVRFGKAKKLRGGFFPPNCSRVFFPGTRVKCPPPPPNKHRFPGTVFYFLPKMATSSPQAEVWERTYPLLSALKCPCCSACMWAEKSFVRHVRSHFLAPPKEVWVCDVCRTLADSRIAIAQHHRSHQPRATSAPHPPMIQTTTARVATFASTVKRFCHRERV